MPVRVVPLVLLLLFLVLAFGLMSIPFLAREGTPVVSAAAPLAFRADLGTGSVNGELHIAEGRAFRAMVRLDAGGGVGPGARAVTFVLEMPDHDMLPVIPRVTRTDARNFTASGVLPMPGRWELRLETPDGQAAIPFRVDG